MDQSTLEQLWQQQTPHIDAQQNTAKQLLEQVTQLSVKDKLRSFWWLNSITLVMALLLEMMTMAYVADEWLGAAPRWYIVASGLILAAWLVMIMQCAIRQLVRHSQLDYSGGIAQLQRQLCNIELSALAYFRLSLCIAPFYMVFVIVLADGLFGFDVIQHTQPAWLWSQVACSAVIAIGTVWLFRLLVPANIDKPMVRWIMQGAGSQARDAANALNTINQMENA